MGRKMNAVDERRRKDKVALTIGFLIFIIVIFLAFYAARLEVENGLTAGEGTPTKNK
jgi:hypothetical protein